MGMEPTTLLAPCSYQHDCKSEIPLPSQETKTQPTLCSQAAHQTVPDCRAEARVKALSRFLVNTAAVSPYSVLLALLITSSILLNFIIG